MEYLARRRPEAAPFVRGESLHICLDQCVIQYKLNIIFVFFLLIIFILYHLNTKLILNLSYHNN
jgi:hypothetical protein